MEVEGDVQQRKRRHIRVGWLRRVVLHGHMTSLSALLGAQKLQNEEGIKIVVSIIHNKK
jgi:hypothetical protein